MSELALVALGGTISMRVVDGLAVPTLGAAEVAGLLGPGHGLRAFDVVRIGGSEVDFGHLRAVGETIAELAADGVHGVVVTTGTDSIEETAAWLTYTGPWPIPVVVTGSMRPGGEPRSDAPANLATAVEAARAPLTGEPTVAFAGRVWLGRAAQKVSGIELDAFASPGFPALGEVDSSGVVRPAAVAPPPASTLGAPGGFLEPVPLVTAALGTDGTLLKQAAEGAAAVVVAGNGAGNLPPAMADVATDLSAAGVLVAVATRAADARTGPLYGYPGSGGRLAAAGAVLAKGMTPHRVRVFLTIALSQGLTGETLRAVLLTHLESLT